MTPSGDILQKATKRDSNRCCGSLKASLNGENPRDISQHNNVVDKIDFVLAFHRQQMKIENYQTNEYVARQSATTITAIVRGTRQWGANIA